MSKIAVVSGSFDPITVGHADVIKRAEDIFGKVVVAVSRNSEKKGLLSDSSRLESVKAAFADDENVSVVQLEGLLSVLVKNLDGVLVRGLRSVSDFDYEKPMALMNKDLEGVETVFLPASPEYEFVSSTFVRDLIRYGRDISAYVPKGAAEVILNEINNDN